MKQHRLVAGVQVNRRRKICQYAVRVLLIGQTALSGEFEDLWKGSLGITVRAIVEPFRYLRSELVLHNVPGIAAALVRADVLSDFREVRALVARQREGVLST